MFMVILIDCAFEFSGPSLRILPSEAPAEFAWGEESAGLVQQPMPSSAGWAFFLHYSVFTTLFFVCVNTTVMLVSSQLLAVSTEHQRALRLLLVWVIGMTRVYPALAANGVDLAQGVGFMLYYFVPVFLVGSLDTVVADFACDAACERVLATGILAPSLSTVDELGGNHGVSASKQARKTVDTLASLQAAVQAMLVALVRCFFCIIAVITGSGAGLNMLLRHQVSGMTAAAREGSLALPQPMEPGDLPWWPPAGMLSLQFNRAPSSSLALSIIFQVLILVCMCVIAFRFVVGISWLYTLCSLPWVTSTHTGRLRLNKSLFQNSHLSSFASIFADARHLMKQFQHMSSFRLGSAIFSLADKADKQLEQLQHVGHSAVEHFGFILPMTLTNTSSMSLKLPTLRLSVPFAFKEPNKSTSYTSIARVVVSVRRRGATDQGPSLTLPVRQNVNVDIHIKASIFFVRLLELALALMGNSTWISRLIKSVPGSDLKNRTVAGLAARVRVTRDTAPMRCIPASKLPDGYMELLELRHGRAVSSILHASSASGKEQSMLTLTRQVLAPMISTIRSHLTSGHSKKRVESLHRTIVALLSRVSERRTTQGDLSRRLMEAKVQLQGAHYNTEVLMVMLERCAEVLQQPTPEARSQKARELLGAGLARDDEDLGQAAADEGANMATRFSWMFQEGMEPADERELSSAEVEQEQGGTASAQAGLSQAEQLKASAGLHSFHDLPEAEIVHRLRDLSIFRCIIRLVYGFMGLATAQDDLTLSTQHLEDGETKATVKEILKQLAQHRRQFMESCSVMLPLWLMAQGMMSLSEDGGSGLMSDVARKVQHVQNLFGHQSTFEYCLLVAAGSMVLYQAQSLDDFVEGDEGDGTQPSSPDAAVGATHEPEAPSQEMGTPASTSKQTPRESAAASLGALLQARAGKSEGSAKKKGGKRKGGSAPQAVPAASEGGGTSTGKASGGAARGGGPDIEVYRRQFAERASTDDFEAWVAEVTSSIENRGLRMGTKSRLSSFVEKMKTMSAEERGEFLESEELSGTLEKLVDSGAGQGALGISAEALEGAQGGLSKAESTEEAKSSLRDGVSRAVQGKLKHQLVACKASILKICRDCLQLQAPIPGGAKAWYQRLWGVMYDSMQREPGTACLDVEGVVLRPSDAGSFARGLLAAARTPSAPFLDVQDMYCVLSLIGTQAQKTAAAGHIQEVIKNAKASQQVRSVDTAEETESAQDVRACIATFEAGAAAAPSPAPAAAAAQPMSAPQSLDQVAVAVADAVADGPRSLAEGFGWLQGLGLPDEDIEWKTCLGDLDEAEGQVLENARQLIQLVFMKLQGLYKTLLEAKADMIRRPSGWEPGPGQSTESMLVLAASVSDEVLDSLKPDEATLSAVAWGHVKDTVQVCAAASQEACKLHTLGRASDAAGSEGKTGAGEVGVPPPKANLERPAGHVSPLLPLMKRRNKLLQPESVRAIQDTLNSLCDAPPSSTAGGAGVDQEMCPKFSIAPPFLLQLCFDSLQRLHTMCIAAALRCLAVRSVQELVSAQDKLQQLQSPSLASTARPGMLKNVQTACMDISLAGSLMVVLSKWEGGGSASLELPADSNAVRRLLGAHPVKPCLTTVRPGCGRGGMSAGWWVLDVPQPSASEAESLTLAERQAAIDSALAAALDTVTLSNAGKLVHPAEWLSLPAPDATAGEAAAADDSAPAASHGLASCFSAGLALWLVARAMHMKVNCLAEQALNPARRGRRSRSMSANGVADASTATPGAAASPAPAESAGGGASAPASSWLPWSRS